MKQARASLRVLSWKERQRRRRRREGERETIAFFEELDPDINRNTSPPIDESVHVRCAWAIEFYTPAHMDQLAMNLMHFNHTSSVRVHNTELLDNWVDELHRVRYGGGWVNLGTLVRKGERSKFINPTREVELPPSVDYAIARAFRVSPSTVCIAVCFVFDDNFSAIYDRELRKYRNTYTERTTRGSSILTPDLQKSASIECIRSEISGRSTDWFRDHFPGIFSSGSLERNVPICEFMTLLAAKPFPQTQLDVQPVPKYLDLLGLGNGWDAWRHADIHGLHFSVQRGRRGSRLNFSTLSANSREFPAKVDNFGGHEGLSAHILYFDRSASGLLCMWASLALLDVFTENLNQVRNSNEFRTGATDEPLENLQRLRDHMSSLADVGTVLGDFFRDPESLLWSVGPIMAFEPCAPELHSPSATLDAFFRCSITERAHWLHDTNLSVRDQLAQVGMIINASENVRLQKSVAKLTWCVVGLTVLAVVLAALQPFGTDWITDLPAVIVDVFAAGTGHLPR